MSYTYNADGLRTSKTVNNEKYIYYWNGNKLMAQTWGENSMYFRYDGDTPIGFKFNGTEYYYVTNLQGDIIAILDSNGTCVVEYEYDAWGRCSIIKDTNTIAYINPLRYRGYYYDSDTDLYYLQSRYYDANTGRFINADEPEMILEGVYNLFSYCENNPVMYSDPYGYMFKYTIASGKYKVSGCFNKSPHYSAIGWKNKANYANCYAYALNIYGDLYNDRLQPGYLSGKYYNAYSGSIQNKIISAFKEDLKKISKDLHYNRKNYLTMWDYKYFGPVYGSGYCVALVLSISKSGYYKDYHWYRQDKDGYWSHKRGLLPVTNLDASGKKIKDPKKADRNYSSSGGLNYNVFVGYFKIYRYGIW